MAFSSQGDRIALTQIEQMVDGQYHKLGYYDTQADNLTWFNNEQWVGGKVNKLRLKWEKVFFVPLLPALVYPKSGRQTFPSVEKFYAQFYFYDDNGRGGGRSPGVTSNIKFFIVASKMN